MRLKIVFLHHGLNIDGRSLERAPLGGTETAMILTAKELAANPENEVHLFTVTPTAEEYDGVHYHPLGDLGAWSVTNSCDIFLCIRQWVPFLFPLRARYRIYFSPDAWDQPFLHSGMTVSLTVNGENLTVPLFGPSDFLPNVDALFCVGRWQANTFETKLGLPREKLHVTANGVVLENFLPLPLAERRPRLMYSSTPFRGLEHLVRYFPALKLHYPAVELEVCSGMKVYGTGSEEDERAYGALYRALAAIGAVSHGSIPQRELSRLMCANRVFTYPNTFDETFCISVLEAQAAGLPVVTSEKAALTERVSSGVDGFLIAGTPGTADYDRDFMAATLRLLKDNYLWCAMSQQAKAKAALFTYEKLARNWESEFAERLKQRPEPLLPQDVALWNRAAVTVVHPTRPEKKLQIDSQALRFLFGQFFQLYGFTLT